jgi:hypothetical protein
MLHGAGKFTYIWASFRVNVGKYSSTMEHLGKCVGYYSWGYYVWFFPGNVLPYY